MKKILLLSCLVLILSFVNASSIVSNIELEPEYAHVSPGEDFIFQLNVYQFEEDNLRDIKLSIYLKENFEEKSLIEEQTIAIKTQTSTILRGQIPLESKEGAYKLIIEIYDIKTNLKLSEASQRIIVANDSYFTEIDKNFIKIGFLIIVIFTISLIAYMFHELLNKK